MRLLADKLSKEQAKELVGWKYPGEYSIYNLPSWEVIVKEKYSLADSVRRENYIAYMNDEGKLVGFVNLSLDKDDTVFFGVGVNPDCCGVGLGKIITGMALIESQKRFPNKAVVLEVRTWNERAINCYKSQGFKIIEKKQQETYAGKGEFYRMSYTAQ